MVTQEEGTEKVKCKYYTHTHLNLHFCYTSFFILFILMINETLISLKFVFSQVFICQFFMSLLFLHIFHLMYFHIIYSQCLVLFCGRRTILGIWHTHTTWNRDWDQKWALSLLHCGRKEMYVPVHSLIRNTHKITFFFTTCYFHYNLNVVFNFYFYFLSIVISLLFSFQFFFIYSFHFDITFTPNFIVPLYFSTN